MPTATAPNPGAFSLSAPGARANSLGGLPDAQQTRPPGFNPSPAGGITIIPRRGWNGGMFGFGAGIGGFGGGGGFGLGFGAGGIGTGSVGANDMAFLTGSPLSTSLGLLRFATYFPGRASELLAEIHPTASKAQSNWISASAAPEECEITAYRGTAQGDEETDSDTSALVSGFFAALPQTTGGLDGLREKGALSLLHYGLFGIEAIPGPLGTGLSGIGLVDPQTIVFGLDKNGVMQIFQQQGKAAPPQDGVPPGLRMLNQETFFWVSRYASVTNPAGIAVFAAAVEQMLKSRAFAQDLADGFHNSAWKRYVYKYSLETLYAIATKPPDQGGLGLLPYAQTFDVNGNPVASYPANEWVAAQIGDIKTYLSSPRPDDNITADSSGGVETLDGADFAGMDPVISYNDMQDIRALDEVPTTMGSPKAGAQTYTTVEYQSQADKYESLAQMIMAPILRAANLHVRLLGIPATVTAEIKNVRKSDAVQEANAASVTAKTWQQLWMDGAATKDDYARQTTGSGVPEEDPHAYVAPAPTAVTVAVPGSDEGGKTADVPQDGTSQD